MRSTLLSLVLFVAAAVCGAANTKLVSKGTGRIPYECGTTMMSGSSRTRVKRGSHGKPAKAGEFPWMANVRGNCGGSLIRDQYVITAGHCVQDWNSNNDNIQLGSLHRNPDDEDRKNLQDFKAAKIIVHEKYNSTTNEYDIALIKLNKPVNFTRYVRSLCLSGTPDGTTEKYTLAGWGLTQDKTPSNILLKWGSTKRHLEICKSRNEKSYLDGKVICASGHYELPCKGDSGGPLMRKSDGRWYLAGITSFGAEECNKPYEAGIFTNVKFFETWITERMNIK